jgi:phosphate-selective porin OprO and OprP
MMRIPAAVLAVAAILAAAVAARAQDDEKARKIKEEAMKERMEALEKKVSGIQESKDPLVTFTANNGLKFKSADGNFEGAIGGRFYFIYRNVFDRADGGGSLPNTFSVDTARLQLDGTFYKDYFYRIEFEHSKTGSVALKDGYIGWKGLEEASFLFGQMKEPFSQEETCSSRFIDFAERSIVNRIVPAHDIGIMAKGTLADKIVEWELGLFNGGSRNAAGRNANDVNDEKDVALRVRATPFKTSDNDWIKNLRIGLAYGIGDVDTTAIADVTTGDLSGLTVLDFNGTEDGLRKRLGVELSWLCGPAGVRAEYMTVNQEIITGTGTGDFDITGYYFQVTCLLTGEDKPLENRVKPKKPFSIKDGGLGAWELAFRIANLDASDGDVDAIPSANNQKVDELTVGVNWWLTQNFRIMFNFERFEFDEDIPQAGSSPIGDQSLFYMRIQIDF